MKELSLFTGIGGGIYGSMILGWETVAYVEQDEYCREVIAQRIQDEWFDKGDIYGDIADFNKTAAHKYAGQIDVLTGGFPCQPFSVAGERKGTSDDRWLFDEIIKTIEIVRPKRLFFENVPGILGDAAIVTIFKELESIGFKPSPPLLLSSDDCGNIHKRQRVWIYATNTSCKRKKPSIKKQIQRQPYLPRKQSIRGREDLLNGFCSPSPYICRMDDEFPNRGKQLKAIGNGQDPIVMATAYKLLSGEL